MSTFSAYQHIFLRELTVFENYGTLNTVRVIKEYYSMQQKYRELYNKYPNLSNAEQIDLCQYLLDTEQHFFSIEIMDRCRYFLDEGLCYYVPVEEVAHTDTTGGKKVL